MGGGSGDDEVVSHRNNDDGDDWYFADVPVDSHIDVPGSLSRGLEAIRDFCHGANAPVPEGACGVLSLALKNRKSNTERDSAVPTKAMALERVPIV